MQKNSSDKNGFTFIEVLVALGLLAIFMVSVLGTFSSSGIWILRAGERTRARDLATAVVETIRAHSVELLAMDLTKQAQFETVDEDITDGYFVFSLDPDKEKIVVPDPENLKATLAICLHDCGHYYEDNQEVLLEDNLFDVNVKVETKGSNKMLVEMATVISAR